MDDPEKRLNKMREIEGTGVFFRFIYTSLLIGIKYPKWLTNIPVTNKQIVIRTATDKLLVFLLHKFDTFPFKKSFKLKMHHHN